jgi:phosphoribosylpyrophosphate synthetase
MTEPEALTEPTIFKVANIMAQNPLVSRDIVKVTTPNGNRIVSPDILAVARQNYYEDVPNMSLATLRRERNPDIIPEMTTEQLRTLIDELYLTMNYDELDYRRHHYLSVNEEFPEEIRTPESGNNDAPWLGRVFAVLWNRGGIENRPTIIFDHVIPNQMTTGYEVWRENNERTYFENVYRALIAPMNGGKRTGKRPRRIPRRKTRKSRKNKRKTKRRRS